MPGIGSIHAQHLAMREADRDRRRNGMVDIYPDGTRLYLTPGPVGEVVRKPDRRSGVDRREAHELAEAIETIAEEQRELLLEHIRELNWKLTERDEEIRRLQRINAEQRRLLDQADHAEEVA